MSKYKTVVFEIVEPGEIINQQFDGSLHVFSDEAGRAGIEYPSGIAYIGPVSKGLFKSVDESRLEVLYDERIIEILEVQKFLEKLKIKFKSIV